MWAGHYVFQMSRISIDVTVEEHKRLKAFAALKGKTIKEYVIERTLGAAENQREDRALRELESILDERIREAEKGGSPRTVEAIFREAYRKARRK
jgi:hypothetical protein